MRWKNKTAVTINVLFSHCLPRPPLAHFPLTVHRNVFLEGRSGGEVGNPEKTIPSPCWWLFKVSPRHMASAGVWIGTFPLHPKEPWAAARGICQPQGVFPSLHLSCLVCGGWKLWMFIECLLWTRHHRIALIGYKHLFFQADGAAAMAVSVAGWLVLWDAPAPGSTYTPPPPELGRAPRGAP